MGIDYRMAVVYGVKYTLTDDDRDGPLLPVDATDAPKPRTDEGDLPRGPTLEDRIDALNAADEDLHLEVFNTEDDQESVIGWALVDKEPREEVSSITERLHKALGMFETTHGEDEMAFAAFVYLVFMGR